MMISVTVAPTAAFPEISGGGLWCAERFWPVGTTQVTVVDDEFSPLEIVMAEQVSTYRMLTVPAANGGLAPPTPGHSAGEWPPGCTGVPGPFGWPPLPAGELPRDRTTLGMAAYRELLAFSMLVVATLS
ncbi:MAG TPA: hypothetical protein VFG23_05445 [Polyangia bacterium]|nr:hypothetical protein [Polyangia bacterium]